MKKTIVFTFLMLTIVFVGCTGPIDDTTDTVETEETNTTETIKNETAEEEVAIDECSSENPPSIYQGGKRDELPGVMLGKNYLNHCGKKTPYYAIELNENDLIIFDEINNEKSIIKTISTKEPFEVKLVAEGERLPEGTELYLEDSNLYIWGLWADGPGSLMSSFIFSPDSNEYISASSICTGIACDQTVNISGSKSIEKYENIRTITLDGGPQPPEGIFKCLLDLSEPKNLSVDYMEVVGEAFPEKLPCYDPQEGLLGYFDLTTNELSLFTE